MSTGPSLTTNIPAVALIVFFNHMNFQLNEMEALEPRSRHCCPQSVMVKGLFHIAKETFNYNITLLPCADGNYAQTSALIVLDCSNGHILLRHSIGHFLPRCQFAQDLIREPAHAIEIDRYVALY